MVKMINIVGTDTGIGKTYATIKILEYLIQSGFKAAAIKPIATGVIKTEYGYINEDVKYLLDSSNFKLTKTQSNPICFKEPIAPHIAATLNGVYLTVTSVTDLITPIILKSNCDYLLIEGVGGIMVPINQNETYLDILTRLKGATILVVGIKLGCLNHALLTYESLRVNQVNCSGWIANFIDPSMLKANDNLEFLKAKLNIPLIATINYEDSLVLTQFGKDYFK